MRRQSSAGPASAAAQETLEERVYALRKAGNDSLLRLKDDIKQKKDSIVEDANAIVYALEVTAASVLEQTTTTAKLRRFHTLESREETSADMISLAEGLRMAIERAPDLETARDLALRIEAVYQDLVQILNDREAETQAELDETERQFADQMEAERLRMNKSVVDLTQKTTDFLDGEEDARADRIDDDLAEMVEKTIILQEEKEKVDREKDECLRQTERFEEDRKRLEDRVAELIGEARQERDTAVQLRGELAEARRDASARTDAAAAAAAADTAGDITAMQGRLQAQTNTIVNLREEVATLQGTVQESEGMRQKQVQLERDMARCRNELTTEKGNVAALRTSVWEAEQQVARMRYEAEEAAAAQEPSLEEQLRDVNERGGERAGARDADPEAARALETAIRELETARQELETARAAVTAVRLRAAEQKQRDDDAIAALKRAAQEQERVAQATSEEFRRRAEEVRAENEGTRRTATDSAERLSSSTREFEQRISALQGKLLELERARASENAVQRQAAEQKRSDEAALTALRTAAREEQSKAVGTIAELRRRADELSAENELVHRTADDRTERLQMEMYALQDRIHVLDQSLEDERTGHEQFEELWKASEARRRALTNTVRRLEDDVRRAETRLREDRETFAKSSAVDEARALAKLLTARRTRVVAWPR